MPEGIGSQGNRKSREEGNQGKRGSRQGIKEMIVKGKGNQRKGGLRERGIGRKGNQGKKGIMGKVGGVMGGGYQGKRE